MEWSARLEAHLGAFRVEPIRSRAGLVMGDRLALEGLNAVAALVTAAFPERAPEPEFYALTTVLLDRAGGPDWARDYAFWEQELLQVLGFGLDLRCCAATGAETDLIYVSPKSGRAVSRAGGKDWADRLLPLPQFLLNDGAATLSDVVAALRLSGHFLLHQAAPALGREGLPDARDRFLRVLDRKVRADAEI